MSFLFTEVLKMSLVASFIILIVQICRILLSKMPKVFSYALWGIVLFRLLCPMTFTMPFSLVPSSLAEGKQIEEFADGYYGTTVTVSESRDTYREAVQNGIVPERTGSSSEAYVTVAEDGISTVPTIETQIFPTLANVWAIGIACMILFSILSLIRLKRKLIGSVPLNLEDRIYLSDYIDTPFVIGIIKPTIYLPSNLNEEEMKYVLLHEKHHIWRKDYIIKILAFLALSLHWFNPLVWFAFIEASKDMEMSCDEAVVRKLEEGEERKYSSVLLAFATGKRAIGPTQLAFGEGDTKDRIKNILQWKEPKKWMVVVAAMLCLVVGVGLLGNRETKVDDSTRKDTEIEIIETFEAKDPIDSYDEWIHHTYYKMSGNTWVADFEDEDGNVTKQEYQYRMVFHERMPNAAVDSNYIVLSNQRDLTFKQVWMASGFSSNLDDYFQPEEAVIVSSWLGALECNHVIQNDGTIYHVEEDDESDRTFDCFGYNVVFPDNTTWAHDLRFYNVDENYRKITYRDDIAEADCTLDVVQSGKGLYKDVKFDESKTELWEAAGVQVDLKYTSDGKTVYAIWEYSDLKFAIRADFTGEYRDGSPIAKMALHMIRSME